MSLDSPFKTGPGFFAAFTSKFDDTVPPGKMRLYCARIEAYDGPQAKGTSFDDVSFKILAAMAQDDKRVARALLELGKHIEQNRAAIEEAAR